MKSSKIKIYTHDNKNGNTATEIITKHQLKQIYPLSSSTNTFSTTQKKSTMSTKHKTPSNNNTSSKYKSISPITTTKPTATTSLTKAKSKPIITEIKPVVNERKVFSPFKNKFSSKERSYISRERIELSIGEIIKLKQRIKSLENEPSNIVQQNATIKEHFQLQLMDLNQIKETLLNERFQFVFKEEEQKKKFETLRTKYISLLNTLESNDKQLNTLTPLYDNQLSKFNVREVNEKDFIKKYKHFIKDKFSINDAQQYLQLTYPDMITSNNKMNNTNSIEGYYILPKIEIETISMLLRVIFTVLSVTKEQLIDMLFISNPYKEQQQSQPPSTEFNKQYINEIAIRLFSLIQRNCPIPHTVEILKLYVANIYFNINNINNNITATTSSSQTANSVINNNNNSINIVSQSQRSFTKSNRICSSNNNNNKPQLTSFQRALLTHIGVILTYTEELIPIYKEKIRQILLKSKKDLRMLCKETDQCNLGTISLKIFKQFLYYNNNIDYTFWFTYHRETLEYLLHLMKHPGIDGYDKCLDFYELDYENLFDIINQTNANNYIVDNYIQRIQLHLQQTNQTFNEFIDVMDNHLQWRKGIVYVDETPFMVLLRVNKIIRPNQVITKAENDDNGVREGSLINLTKMKEIIMNNNNSVSNS